MFVVLTQQTQHLRHKLKQRKFKLDVSKNAFLRVIVVEYWGREFVQAVKSLSVQVCCCSVFFLMKEESSICQNFFRNS